VLWSLGYRYSFWHLVNAAREVQERTEMVLEQLNLAGRRHVPAGVLAYAEQRALEIGHRRRRRRDPARRAHRRHEPQRDRYVMGHGRIVFEDTPDDLRRNEAVRREWLEV
jgi:ABC-type branched-subunit amino acid transport system ATPase component